MTKQWFPGWTTGKVIVTGMMLVLLTACSSQMKDVSDLGLGDAPDWVKQGTSLIEDDGERLFHGVGSAPPMGDTKLQLNTADSRARAALAGVVSNYMEVVSGDYLAAAGASASAINERTVSHQINTITKISLVGARVIGRWRNKRTNVKYSLVELDMKHVKDVVGKLDKMNEGLRNFILGNSDNIFDRVMK